MTSVTLDFPPATSIRLNGGRMIDVRDSGFPTETSTDRCVPLVLIHGWLATADLNWGFTYPTLTERFRVVAFDQPGHGNGDRSHRHFNFDECADDLALVLDALAIDRAIVVGYSMGGPIALTFAKRHAEQVAGLVLCATAGAFTSSPIKRALFSLAQPVANATRLVPDSPLRHAARRRFIERRATGRHADWIADELMPSDLSSLIQAGVAIARFDASPWLASIDSPCTSVITVDDQLVSPASQRALARGIPRCEVIEVTGGHTTCFDHPERFAPAVEEACRMVADRVGGAT